MGKILYNKNTRTSSSASSMFDNTVLAYGEIVLDNNSQTPGLYMTKDGGSNNPTPFKLNDADNIYVSSVLDSGQTGDVAVGDDLHTALSKIKNSVPTTADAEKLAHNVAFTLSGETNGSATTNLSGETVLINTYKTFTTVTSLSNLTFKDFLTVATIAADAVLTISSNDLVSVPTGGVKEGHLLINNSSAQNIAVEIATDLRVKTTNGNTFSIEAGGIGELNALITNNGSAYTIYIITS